jgi:uncharacterized protein (TIGR03083 family)
VSDPRSWVSTTYLGLADLLEAAGPTAWDSGSLCAGWSVRHVVAHVSMPIRLTPEQYGKEIAAAGGDFTAMSDAISERDAALPVADHLAALRSPQLHEWEPPGGGSAGAISHAAIHSLDVTLALGKESVAPLESRLSLLDQLVAANGTYFGLNLDGRSFEATDTDWRCGEDERMTADTAELVALLSGRILPDGRRLPRT